MDKSVNDISFSKKLGDSDRVSGYELFYEHYQLDTVENRHRLAKELGGCLLDTNIVFNEDGLLTVRFLINKDGIADRFRPAFLSTNYKEVILMESQTSTIKIIDCLKSKKEWQKGTVDGKPRSYHTLINLRIKNGKIDAFF